MASGALDLPDTSCAARLRVAPMLLAAYAGLLFFMSLGARDLTSSHEARAAQNAQMLLDEGDWLLPRLFDGTIELQKPPLYYWLVAGIAWWRGGQVDAWAVRLPSALAALGCVLWLYYLGLRRGRPVAGMFAALVLASCLHFTWLARVGRVDMPLTLAIAVALGSFELAGHSRRHRVGWQWVGYTVLGLGVLLKGPIALVLAGLVIVANRPGWRQTSLWWGVPWLLLLTLPWFLLVNARTGGRLWDVFVWHHNLERGLGASDTLAVHPWWFYVPRGLVDLLPWSLLLPAALWFRRRGAADREARLGLLWFASIFVFLSCMSFKRADYLVPAYPGFAIFLGAVMEAILAPKGLHYSAQGRVRSEPALGSSQPADLPRGGFIRATADECNPFVVKNHWRSPALGAVGIVLLIYASGWLGYDAWAASADGAYHEAIAREIRRQTSGPVIFFRAESHLLAFHVGRPMNTILEWENLEIWANEDRPVFFVMPQACADEWRSHLARGELIEVLRSADWVRGLHDRPLVVMRNQVQGAR